MKKIEISKNIKLFLIALLASLPFWWGANVLEGNLQDFFFWQKTKDLNLKAQISQPLIVNYSSLKPIRDWKVADLQIQAKSAISVDIDEKGKKKVLFQKDADKILPIASLTKLMTALVTIENYDLNHTIKITEEIVSQEGDTGRLQVGQNLRVEDLLYISLIESSNDAAYALASGYNGNSKEEFVDLMNLKAKSLELKNTYFANSTGLDSDNPNLCENYSTAKDLVKLTEALLKEPLILNILSATEFELYLPNGVFHHILKNTNELLGKVPSAIVGKTGWTPRAGGCLLLVSKSPKTSGFLINIILGSEDRFGEMEKIVNWIPMAYKW